MVKDFFDRPSMGDSYDSSQYMSTWVVYIAQSMVSVCIIITGMLSKTVQSTKLVVSLNAYLPIHHHRTSM